MAGTSNSITTHNVLSGVLNADNVISGLVNTAFNPAYALVTQAGAQIVLFINNNDYKMYAQLKDKSGNLIYTSNIIDLPLETMVVAGRYDSNTKKLILVLDNGNEIEVPLEALISGLVNEDDLIANYYDKDEIDALLDGYWTKIELTQEDIDNWNAADAAFESELFDDGVISIEDSIETNINNTMNKSQLKIDLKGNTSQESTTQSANLFDENYYNNDSLYSINVYKNTKLTRIKQRGTLYFKAQLKAGKSEIGSFYLSLCNKMNPNDFPVNAAWAVHGVIVQDDSTSNHNYATFDESDDLYFTYYPTSVSVDTIFDTYNFLISTDNISYVPFVPNSPSPDYPQEVNVVTGDNEVKVEGKNLATENFNDSTTGIALSKTVESGTPIYISSNINDTVNVLYAFMDSTFKGNILVTYSNGKITYSGTPNFTFNRVRCPSDRICTESILALGPTATTYEPYQNQISPINLGSMELCKIGDYQDYIAKSTGKNLFNPTQTNHLAFGSYQNEDILFENASYIGYAFPCEEGEVYSISRLATTNPRFRVMFTATTPAANVEIFGGTGNVNTYDNALKIENIVVPSGAKYMNIYLSNSGGTLPPIQIEKGNTSTSYEPYGKVWYKYGAIGKHTITDSDVSIISSFWFSTYGVYGAGVLKSALNISATATDKESLCSVSTKINEITYIRENVYIFNANGSYVFFFNSDFDTKEHANEKLVGANVYFNLDTPTITPITDTTLIEQLDNLEKAYSYDTQTNISQTNQDKPFILDINAIADNVNGLKLENENQEYKTNKVIELSSNSTDDEYPSAKCVYDIVGNIEAVLAAMDSGSGV